MHDFKDPCARTAKELTYGSELPSLHAEHWLKNKELMIEARRYLAVEPIVRYIELIKRQFGQLCWNLAGERVPREVQVRQHRQVA